MLDNRKSEEINFYSDYMLKIKLQALTFTAITFICISLQGIGLKTFTMDWQINQDIVVAHIVTCTYTYMYEGSFIEEMTII